MNAKTDGWESYTDHTGRRHWRWPAAADRQIRAGSAPEEKGSRQKIGSPGQDEVRRSPVPLPGK